MIKTTNFPNAYKEVYTILENVEDEDLKLISNDFIKMLEENMNKNYEFEFNPELDFSEQKILRETKVILAYIFMNYWGNEKQIEIIKKQFNKDIIEEENEKKKMFSSEIFNNEQNRTNKNNENISNDKEINALVEIKKEKWYKKIFEKIKKFLKLNK